MPVVISRDTALGIELARWDTPRNKPVLNSSGDPARGPDGAIVMGMGPVGPEEYPKMLFKARQHPQTGQTSVGDVMPHPMHYSNAADLERATNFVESFNRSCQTIVSNSHEEARMRDAGWSLTQDGALEAFEKEQQYLAQIAAEENFKAKRLSEKAQAEWTAAGEQTHEHVTDVIGSSKKTHGATDKIKPVTGSSNG